MKIPNIGFPNFTRKNLIKKIIYFRTEGSGEGYAGVGNGLYLGKDKSAIENFYNIDEYVVNTYKEIDNIKWLTDDSDYKQIESEFNGDILNSSNFGDYIKSLGYDGIRYYDYNATGEEFVLLYK